MIKLRAGAVALATAVVLSCGAPKATVEAGTIAVCCCVADYPRQYLKSPSRHVLQYQPPWEAFGFFLRFPSADSHTVSITHRLPGVPEELGSDWRELGYQPADAPNGLTAAPVEVRGGRWFSFNTEPGDPTGTYRFEIAIDGKHWQAVEFEVSPGGSATADPGPPPECPKNLVDKVP